MKRNKKFVEKDKKINKFLKKLIYLGLINLFCNTLIFIKYAHKLA